MRRRAAFTLLEVLVSIAIFMLLAGGIFAAVRASFTASRQIVISQLDSERLVAFQQFLRRLFVSLPSDAHVELRLRQMAGLGDVVEMRVWPIPAFLQFGTNSSDGAAISAQPDGHGSFRMMLGYFRANDTIEQREDRLRQTQWLTLLPGVERLQWKFAPSRNPVLEDKWNEQSGRPGLAELSLEMKESGSSTFQFWIPPLQRRSSGISEGGPPKPNAPIPDSTPPSRGENQ